MVAIIKMLIRMTTITIVTSIIIVIMASIVIIVAIATIVTIVCMVNRLTMVTVVDQSGAFGNPALAPNRTMAAPKRNRLSAVVTKHIQVPMYLHAVWKHLVFLLF